MPGSGNFVNSCTGKKKMSFGVSRDTVKCLDALLGYHEILLKGKIVTDQW